VDCNEAISTAKLEGAMKNLSRWIAIACCGALLAAPVAAQQTVDADAAAFPNRALRIVVPFPAGGPSDVLARMVGQKMSEDWGQPVLIENRVGANTVIGAQAVQKSAADGYTMLMAIDSTLAMNQYLYRSLPYDPFNDFAPITLVAKTMMFMFVNSGSGPNTVKDLIAQAKAQPGKLNFGAGTITSKLMGHLVNKTVGIDTQLISYNGSAEVTQGLLTRSVHFTYDGPSAAMSLIQSGQFRILAKFDNRPFPPAPDTATFAAAASLPGFDELTVWLGLVAPRGTPASVIGKLQREVAGILADPAVKAKADAAGLFPVTTTPEEFASFIRKEADRWAPIVKDSGLRYD
jgi:tripartite-type tricarboxylate transporter receptor subunit TctC